ncbi:hypothetical protein MKY34_12305 [Sporosarcina sp. FSL K6-1522]|uniref:hypothetical protein n=1 Tax=Sporosarcina sp. FSL K6-1522 TaxID=2921554 RepID=UPI00315AF854
MSKPAVVRCDNCMTPFTIQPKEKKHGNGIVETYFHCPKCNERFTSFATNAVIRRKQREIKKLYDLLPTIMDIGKYKDMLHKIQGLKSELEPMMKELKGKVMRKS